MMELAIYPDKVLRKRASAFKESELGRDGSPPSGVSSIARSMIDLMYRKKGLGLAGPQAGISRRLFVIDVTEDRNSPIILINPKIVSTEGTQEVEEGCLSFPSLYAQVKRAAFVKVAYIDENGREKTIEGEKLIARLLQHEYDHLEGVLFIDRLSAAQRLALRKELKEMERAAEHSR